jgi:hypothetical protein
VRLGADGARPTLAPVPRWSRCSSSARPGRVINVPFDTSRRYGEVVHDGEPKGDRVVGNRAYRVFDELALFEPSSCPPCR